MRRAFCVLLFAFVLPAPLFCDSFNFSTGAPDGKVGMASRPSSNGQLEIEAADDFILASQTNILSATFTGLLPSGTSLNSILNVIVEIYRVFPKDSTVPPSGNVPTRTNSPSDVALQSKDASAHELTWTATVVNSSFNVANSVVNGINPKPNQTTQGEGPATGEEVQFSVFFNSAFDLPADHYFFVPQVQLGNGTFLWLSAPKPTAPPLFVGDLQTWMRNENLAPDWLRVGTDIIGAGAFNASFSVSGSEVPEPTSLLLLASGLGGFWLRRKVKK